MTPEKLQGRIARIVRDECLPGVRLSAPQITEATAQILALLDAAPAAEREPDMWLVENTLMSAEHAAHYPADKYRLMPVYLGSPRDPRAAPAAERERTQYWRNNAFEAAAQIVERYGVDPQIADDIRAHIRAATPAAGREEHNE